MREGNTITLSRLLKAKNMKVRSIMNDNERKETVNGYEIQRSILFENNRGFALAENPDAPDPFVTWQFTEDENGARDYYWGHYAGNRYTATRDYEMRVDSYHKDNEIGFADGYLYYSTQRPVDIGTFPKTENGPIIVANFDTRENVVKEEFKAWGYLVYDSPLTEKQIGDYELRAAHDNPDIVKRMREQAQTVGRWEEIMTVSNTDRFTRYRSDIRAFEMRSPRVSPGQMATRFEYAKSEVARIDRKRAAQKSITEQLAEAGNQVEHSANMPVKKNDKSHNR